MTRKMTRSDTLPFYVARSGIILSRIHAMADLIHSISGHAYTRRQYKNCLEGQLTCAFASFIRTKLALWNGKRQYARRWREDVVDKIEYELAGWLLHPTQGSCDRRKAALEALENVSRDEQHNRRTAAFFLKRDFGLKEIRPLPRDAAAEFFAWVQTVVDTVFLLEETRSPAAEGGRMNHAPRNRYR
jgi:hypothetical protein